MSTQEGQRDVILMSTADWATRPWTNKQHVALALARLGHRVLYVDSLPLRRPVADRRDASRIVRRLLSVLPGPRRVDESVWVLSPPALPAGQGGVRNRLNRWMVGCYVRRHAGRLGFRRPLLWVYNPAAGFLLDFFPGSSMIYHCVDNLAAVPGVDGDLIRALEEVMVEKVERVFVTNPHLEHSWIQHGANVTYQPNVIPDEWVAPAFWNFAEPEDLQGIPHPRVGFVGTLSDYKIEWAWLRQLVERRPEYNCVLIGDVREGEGENLESLLRHPNVHHLGFKIHGDLPAYLQHLDVGILPLKRNEYTEGMFPMKFFEYLAAGVAVVSTKLPYLSGFEGLCCAAENGEQFLLCVDGAVECMHKPKNESIHEMLARYTYTERTREMLKIIGEDEARCS